MLFTNFSFFLFFITFILLYSLVNQKLQKIILLFGNLFFCYFTGWQSFTVAIGVIFITYFFAFFKKELVLSGVMINVLILIFFKYISSFYPVGISFYVFTSIAYLVDVYLQRIPAEKNLFNFLNFILFFPKFISGPVERVENLQPQLSTNIKCKISFQNVQLGFQLFLFGFFKKICIANRLQIYVDKVFDNLGNFGGLALIIATIFYSVQIYCDFSGYTDMALGIAKVFGVNLTQNFKNPYSAVSIGEFWHKWHISLSSWLKDYIYIPLGGNRKGNIRKNINIFITFFVSGLWHGNTLNFCIWGGVHALAQIFENIFKIPLSSINTKIRNIFTIIIIGFAWIFFRLNTLSDIPLFFTNLVSPKFFNIESFKIAISGINFSTYNNMTPSFLLNVNVFVCLFIFFTISRIEVKSGLHISNLIIQKKTSQKYLYDYLLMIMIFVTGLFDSTRFIYAAF